MIITPLRTVIAVSITWILTIILIIFPTFNMGKMIFFQPTASCLLDFSLRNGYYSFIFFILALIPMVFLVVCNIWVASIVLKNINAIYNVHSSMGRVGNNINMKAEQDILNKRVSKERHKKQINFFRVFGGLQLSTVITWLPTIIKVILTLGGIDLYRIFRFTAFTHIIIV